MNYKGRKRVIRFISMVTSVAMLFVVSCGCGNKSADKTITLTIWHVYGEQASSPLNELIDEFNMSVGLQKGINVKATKVSDTNTIHEVVLESDAGGPGTEDLPDIFVAYPKTVLAMTDNETLVDYHDYLSEDEKEAFIGDFLDEGMINGRLTILPIAKSTEVLFVNKTLFNRYAEASGASLDDLSTWEGLFKTARNYHEMTGKPFLADDYLFNYFQMGVASKGSSMFSDTGIVMDQNFESIWEPMAEAAIDGGVWLGSGYASEALRTGDAVVSFASSAGVLYYSDNVTYEDNTTASLELISLPCPTYEGGEKLAMNRGAGLCLVKSDKEREEAAMTFLRWLLDPERNVSFVTKAGYMPVTEKGFDDYLPDAVSTLESPRYKSLYNTFMAMQKDDRFYTPPQYNYYLDKETLFEKNIRQILSEESKQFLGNDSAADGASMTDAEAAERHSELVKYRDESLERLKEIME